MVLMLLLANAGTPPEGLAQDYAASAYAMAGDEREVPTIDERAGWSDAEVVAHLARTLSLVRDADERADEATGLIGEGPSVRARLRSPLVA
ncbi:hypothetical protein AIF0345_1077 [Actinomyces israelii]|nr:hypothetical protein AIF0345_1077 [Actinomyces israelii]